MIGPHGGAPARFKQWLSMQDFTGLPPEEIASLGFDAGHAFWHESTSERAPVSPDASSRAMFVARLQNQPAEMVFKAQDVLGLLNDCDMLASRERAPGADSPEPVGWQPIETAPKDGTRILASWDGGDHGDTGTHLTFFLDNSKTAHPWAGWRVSSLEVRPLGKPTHWMPLLAAPSAVESRASSDPLDAPIPSGPSGLHASGPSDAGSSPCVGAEAPPMGSQALRDVAAERQRQQAVEGWTAAHDDEHRPGHLATAGYHYAANAAACLGWQPGSLHTWDNWPWAPEWWKPTTPRRDLVKAGALILAEIERIDRNSK